MTRLQRSTSMRIGALVTSVCVCLLAGTDAPALNCPHAPTGGGETIDGLITRPETGCTIDPGSSGKFVKRGTTFVIDTWASCGGQCAWFFYGCSPLPCGCKYSGTTELRKINHIDVLRNYNGVDDPMPFKEWAVQNGQTVFRQLLDTRIPGSTSPGPLPWLPVASGEYLWKFGAIINKTLCNILPGQTEVKEILVHARCALHKGSPCEGWLDGGQELSSQTWGYYHYHGEDPPHDDAWGGCESTIDTIDRVGTAFRNSYGARIGVGDISRPGGGDWDDHECHENGLDIDARYVREDYSQQAVDLLTSFPSYNRTATIALLRIWAATDMVESIIVDPAADITPADVPGVPIIVDQDPRREHRNHYHVRLKDPDGPDQNNC